jgi:hypothetical protein
MIGAHAAVTGCPLLAREPRRYAAYFPSLALVTPEPCGMKNYACLDVAE